MTAAPFTGPFMSENAVPDAPGFMGGITIDQHPGAVFLRK
jgi:hypothetical protein